jgi:hypothetical protein
VPAFRCWTWTSNINQRLDDPFFAMTIILTTLDSIAFGHCAIDIVVRLIMYMHATINIRALGKRGPCLIDKNFAGISEF